MHAAGVFAESLTSMWVYALSLSRTLHVWRLQKHLYVCSQYTCIRPWPDFSDIGGLRDPNPFKRQGKFFFWGPTTGVNKSGSYCRALWCNSRNLMIIPSPTPLSLSSSAFCFEEALISHSTPCLFICQSENSSVIVAGMSSRVSSDVNCKDHSHGLQNVFVAFHASNMRQVAFFHRIKLAIFLKNNI